MRKIALQLVLPSRAPSPVPGLEAEHPEAASPFGSPGDAIAERSLLLSTAAATSKDRRIVFAVAIASVLAFLAIVPFAKVPMAPLPAFIPFYQSALVFNDLVTAVLLFGQFSMLRSRALLLLAGAYLFTACMALAHALSFPGLFAPAGLLGAGPQTTAWLYMFWHGGLPLLVMAHALLRGRSFDVVPAGAGRFGVAVCIAAVLAGGCGLVLLAAAGEHALPVIMQGHGYAPAMAPVAAGVWLLSVAAAVTMWRRSSHTVLDLWLVVAMFALSLDIALSAGLNAGRFDLGFYAGRIYGLLATSFVLVVLLLESNRLYALLVETHKSDRAKAAELRRLSTLDPLTRIANRRAFEETIDREWRRTLRHQTPLCLIMIDVDCFKRFNDRYGHVSGDQCLRAVAQVLAGNARRSGELAARYGGEEFAVLLPHADAEKGRQVAQRICEEVRELDIPHETSTVARHVTISVGVAEASAMVIDGRVGELGGEAGQWPSPSLLVEHADAALYAAKSSGRNRVAVAGGGTKGAALCPAR